jgi:EAL domain-containing protein (putative c-di-GMP-specific phosphodiesterase class I)
VALAIADVRRALEHDEIVPHFQPLVEIHTGRVMGFEVLARWTHPDLGLILPDKFICLAEKKGLIGELTRQILRKALLIPLLPKPLVVAVNVSPIQLHDLSLPDQIREAAETAGFPLERLTIEITESALAENLVRAQKIACTFKAMGCKLALDDFGHGLSCNVRCVPISQIPYRLGALRVQPKRSKSGLVTRLPVRSL